MMGFSVVFSNKYKLMVACIFIMKPIPSGEQIDLEYEVCAEAIKK